MKKVIFKIGEDSFGEHYQFSSVDYEYKLEHDEILYFDKYLQIPTQKRFDKRIQKIRIINLEGWSFFDSDDREQWAVDLEKSIMKMGWTLLWERDKRLLTLFNNYKPSEYIVVEGYKLTHNHNMGRNFNIEESNIESEYSPAQKDFIQFLDKYSYRRFFQNQISSCFEIEAKCLADVDHKHNRGEWFLRDYCFKDINNIPICCCEPNFCKINIVYWSPFDIPNPHKLFSKKKIIIIDDEHVKSRIKHLEITLKENVELNKNLQDAIAENKKISEELRNKLNSINNISKFGVAECAICFQQFSRNHISRCGHFVCATCVINIEHKDCPVCRSPDFINIIFYQ